MKRKYHISTSNKVVECKANQKTCPRSHYSNQVEAQTAINNTTTPETTPERNILNILAAQNGYNPNDIKDHTGKTITEAWAKKFSSDTYNPEILTVDEIRDAIFKNFNMDGVRDRGEDIVFIPKGTDPYYLPNNEENYSASLENIEKELAEGNEPYYELSTRNGGGNRECYCDDYENHEPYCHAEAAKRLEEHPLHVSNADNEWDHTYATFYYRIPEEIKNSLPAILENTVAKRDQQNKKSTLAAYQSGKIPLHTLLTPNPERQQKVAKIKEQIEKLETLRKEEGKKAFLVLNRENFTVRTPAWQIQGGTPLSTETARNISAIAEAYRTNKPYNEIAHIFNPYPRNVTESYKKAIKSKETVAKIEKLVENYNKTFNELEKENPQLAQALKESTSPKYSLTSTAYRDAKKFADNYDATLAIVEKATKKYVDIETKQQALKVKLLEETNNITWPGADKTIPAFVPAE